MAKKNKANQQPKPVSEAANAFMELVAAYSYQSTPSPRLAPLTNITVWAGAGFSKSWTPSAPVGTKLFTLDTDNLKNVADFGVLSRLFGLQYGSVTPDQLRQIVYQLDMYERYPDVSSRYIDPQNLNIVRAGLRAAVLRKYDTIAELNYFDKGIEKFPLTNESPQQAKILELFRFMHRGADG